MRQTPADDYLEEISTELTEELYGNLSDVIYETVCEFDEKVAQLKAENDKLREERNHWHAEQVHAYGNWEDAHKRVIELEKQNDKLRELCETFGMIANDAIYDYYERDEMLEQANATARELGIEVGK